MGQPQKNRIYMAPKLQQAIVEEKCVTSGDFTWLLEELGRSGSALTRLKLIDFVNNGHFLTDSHEKESIVIEKYFSAKLKLCRDIRGVISENIGEPKF